MNSPIQTPIVSVRRATRDDLPDVARIHVRSWQRAYRGQMPDAVLDALDVEQRTARWHTNFDAPGSMLLLAVIEERTLGFCSLTRSRDADAAPGTAEVAAIYVDPDRYRSGAGTALMQAASEEARCRGDRVLTLWVLDTNQQGRRFYERCGLAWDGATKDVRGEGYSMHELRYRVEL